MEIYALRAVGVRKIDGGRQSFMSKNFFATKAQAKEYIDIFLDAVSHPRDQHDLFYLDKDEGVKLAIVPVNFVTKNDPIPTGSYPN